MQWDDRLRNRAELGIRTEHMLTAYACSNFLAYTRKMVPTNPLVLTPNAWTFGKWSPEEWNGIAFHEVLWSLLFAKTRQTRHPCVISTDGC